MIQKKIKILIFNIFNSNNFDILMIIFKTLFLISKNNFLKMLNY